MGSVIHFKRPKVAERPISPISRELDQFNEARCRMLEAFAALAASGTTSRADLTDEMVSTTGAMRGLRDFLCAGDITNAG